TRDEWRSQAAVMARVLVESETVLSPIRNSINGAIATARQQAISASNQGQFTVNSVYADLLPRIAKAEPAARTAAAIEKDRSMLIQHLEEQALRTRDYSKFGLMSELQVGDMLESVRGMSPERFDIARQVLEPFVRGNDVRLAALRALHIALTTFVESVNELYLNKRLLLHLERGLHISTASNEELAPEQLSSGESQLLILFCEVIRALGPETVLFIDEPEISLNVSWQQALLDRLLKCASGSSVQFVIATHSIELLARHRPNVVRLSSKPIGSSLPAIT